jgi:hypothetical protein
MVLVVRSRQHWDIKCPPAKKQMLAGKLVPTVRGAMSFLHKKRRLVIEVHGHDDEEEGTVISSALQPLPTSVDHFHSNDVIVLRILKPRKHWGLSRDVEDSDSDDDSDDQSLAASEEQGFVEYRRFDLDYIDDVEIHNSTSLEAKFGRGNNTEVRDLKFTSVAEVQDFESILTRLRNLSMEVVDNKVRTFQQEIAASNATSNTEENAKLLQPLSSTITDEDVNLLVEIVSATDLPVADLLSSDPYVVVWLGKEEVHRTKTIPKTTDPIWTVDTGSLFILSTTSRDFFQSSSGLTFLVKDYDAVGSNEVLGKVVIPQQELLQAKAERVEYPLGNLLQGFDATKEVYAPKLNLRVRPATKDDFQFVKTLHKIDSKKRLGVYADEAFVAPTSHSVHRLRRQSKKGINPAQTLHRVKPGPDPERPEDETKWLTQNDIETEHLKPSTSWVETGSGTMGRLYLEVLRCDGLPNMDTGLRTPGDKTDAFCSMLYEDSIVNTDIINDELSPRWMPWSQRAFLFHMQHPSSQILVGVFDCDAMRRNDRIGRVSIDITNLCPNTDYILSYTLFMSVLDEERPPRGTITVRLRIEVDNFRKIVMAALVPPPASFVNVVKMEDFRSARFVSCGEENMHNLDMGALKSYGNELEGYQEVVYYIQQALMTVWLWRGHLQVNLCGWKFKLALHSMVAFVMGIFLVENYDLFPSFFLLSVAWFFLATNEERQRNPSPWNQSATFGEMWTALLMGRTTRKQVMVVDDELKPLITAYEAAGEDRRKEKQESKKNTKKQGSMMDAYFAQEVEEATAMEGDLDNIETNTGRMQLNPLKPILLPIQQILGQVCVSLRVVRSLVTWDESIYAFLLTNACLVGGVALIFVPWGWFIRWALRILVWTLLGPWMKLVDICIVRKLQVEDDNFVKRMESSMAKRSLVLKIHKRAIMVRKENAEKYRAMKSYMFGKYIARVPQFKEFRYPDIPLPSSQAATHEAGYSSVRIVQRKHGQRLVGTMIPSWGDEDSDVTFDRAVETKKGGTASRVNPMHFFSRKSKPT